MVIRKAQAMALVLWHEKAEFPVPMVSFPVCAKKFPVRIERGNCVQGLGFAA
jgi:hypothetical protein